MGLFSSIAGVGLNLLGSKLSQKSQRRGVQDAMQAAAPFNVSGPFGTSTFSGGQLNVTPTGGLRTSMNQAITLGSRALTDLGNLDFLGREEAELARLRAIQDPLNAARRESTLQSLFTRGRLGAARGIGGRMANPELAALAVAEDQADLRNIGAARQFSQGEQQFLANQAGALFNQGGFLGNLALGQAGLGIQSRAPAGIAGLAAQPGFNQARTTEGFFGVLGSQLPRVFGGGGTFAGGGATLNANNLGGSSFDLFPPDLFGRR